MNRPRKTTAAEDGVVEVQCTTHNVSLGDGRQLALGEKAEVPAELADFLVERKQVKRV